MSKRYTADGKRRSSQTHANHPWTCPCGRKVWGNGGKSSHQRACRTWAIHWLATVEASLAKIDSDTDRDRLYSNRIMRDRLTSERDAYRIRLGVEPYPAPLPDWVKRVEGSAE